jgi:hypothetical protein
MKGVGPGTITSWWLKRISALQDHTDFVDHPKLRLNFASTAFHGIIEQDYPRSRSVPLLENGSTM